MCAFLAMRRISGMRASSETRMVGMKDGALRSASPNIISIDVIQQSIPTEILRDSVRTD